MNNKSGRIVFYNGKYINEANASISIYDSALMMGDQVFEMTRSFNGIQFKLREHLERLYAGIKILHIPIEMTIDEMEAACNTVIDINKQVFSENDEHRLLISVSRGILGIYQPVLNVGSECTVIIADFPLKYTVASMAKYYKTGINAVIPSQRAIPAHLLDPRIKNRSRMHYQMANIEVAQMKGDNNWALLQDPDGFIAEGTGANFFIVKDGVVITPEGRNVLRGISRDYVMDICKRLNISCIEKNITAYDVYNADEAFFTATPFCIIPVFSLNGLPITEEIGWTIQSILRHWSAIVGVDIVKQIEDYSKEVSIENNSPTPYQFKTK